MSTVTLNSQITPDSAAITNFESFWNPDFLNFDVMKEWIENLKKKKRRNCKLKASSLFKSVADITCVWCQKLKLTQNVFHRTLELFDQFLLLYISKIKDLQSSTSQSDEIVELGTLSAANNKDIEIELKHKSILFLVSCLQIASKLEDGYKVVSVKQAELLLAEVSKPCGPSTIVHSEIHVLSTLRFDVDVPPISEYVDFLTCELVYLIRRDSSPSSKNVLTAVEEIHEASLLMVHSLYLNTSEVKERIMGEGICTVLHGPGNLTGQNCQDEDHKMVLACGAISASTFRIQPNWATHVMKHLYAASGIHPEVIAHISTVLHDYVEEGIANVLCSKHFSALKVF